MEPTTKALLRSAAMTAIEEEQDLAAFELLQMLHKGAAPEPSLPKLAVLPASVSGEPHGYDFWMSFIREHFIPFMQNNGRVRFTSHELLTWIQRCEDLQLTSGDLQKREQDREIWRRNVSLALQTMKHQGFLHADARCKEYEILRPAIAAAVDF